MRKKAVSRNVLIFHLFLVNERNEKNVVFLLDSIFLLIHISIRRFQCIKVIAFLWNGSQIDIHRNAIKKKGIKPLRIYVDPFCCIVDFHTPTHIQ